ncbi:uncharacterized protein LOC143200083 [Rhynchophorus ferrugineus]|uniref:uncharacterized protein LOC143200083 n=1 Tax=Rhynchophorus ferrugineus TaxID=354439 RepID=UPI003FCE6742
MGANIITKEEFDIFKEALYDDNLVFQIEAVKKLTHFAKALGEKATREELLPFLKSSLNLHEEVLQNLCKQLQNLIPLVGGLGYSKIIFDILTSLCQVDENVIREAAVAAIINIGKDFTKEDVNELVVPVLKELSPDGWFTSKCSAVMLYPPFYTKLDDENKNEVRHNFKIFIQDDSSIVRVTAAAIFSDLIDVVEDQYVKEDFIPMFCDMTLDPLESIKAHSIDIGVSLIKRLDESAIDPSFFKSIETIADHQSWKMKEHVASKLPDFQRYLPYATYRGKILQLFQKLSEDYEMLVRCEVARNASEYLKYLLESYKSRPHEENNFEHVFEQSVMPVIRKLAEDECDDVRLALSINILDTSPLLGDDCSKKTLVPLLQQVLTQQESVGILANYLRGFGSISDKCDPTKCLDAIITCIRLVLARSQADWRSRRAILTTFVDLTKLCAPEFFSDKFKIYFATLLGDQVFAIRRSASLVVPVLTKQYGIKWAMDHLVSYFLSFYQDRKYLYRFVSIFGISEMIQPFVCKSPSSYLHDIRVICEDVGNVNNKKALLCLAHVSKLVKAIENELNTEEYSKYAKLRSQESYLRCSDTKIYSETNYEDLRNKYEDLNVYSVQETDFTGDHIPYLEGLLQLIYRKFLSVLKTLCKDPTNNVSNRAVETLGQVQDFIRKLNEELKDPWVEKCLKQLNQEEISEIESELKTTAKIVDAISLERIDTTLAEEMEAYQDLKETLCIENSSLTPDGTSGDTGTDQTDSAPPGSPVPPIKSETTETLPDVKEEPVIPTKPDISDSEIGVPIDIPLL